VVVTAAVAAAAVAVAAVVAMAVSAAPTALAPAAVAAVVAAAVVAVATAAAATAATEPCNSNAQKDKRLLGSLFSWADGFGPRQRAAWVKPQASPLRFLRPRPCTARSSTALGSMRMTFAITPICHGITR
jgi:hypothetical protein